MPEFPGGEDSIKNFIRTSIKYPDLARESSVEGTVYINFIIEHISFYKFFMCSIVYMIYNYIIYIHY